MTHLQRLLLSPHIMAGQGSTGNVIAALASFFIPGLGQLIQGRIMMALVHFILAAVLWIILLGWLIHLWSIIDAALYKGKGRSTT
jgi:TM2 domain-containing membrane protein YozV